MDRTGSKTARRVLSAGPTSLPVGTVTFLMTDIEGSTRIWDAKPGVAKLALERHGLIIKEQVERNHGHIVEAGREGDSFLAVFRQARDGVSCALDVQRSLNSEPWPGGVDMPVRVALHTGEAELGSGHYVGAPLYRCARLMATASGGQVLISRATEEIVADNLPDGAGLRDLGQHRLHDLSRPEHVFQLLHPDLRSEFPPLKSVDAKGTNLPEQLTSFVGRQSDLAALRKLLREVRLITLTGPGGIGKTRLALQLGQNVEKLWPDGVWWVDLTAVDDPGQLPACVATGLNLPGAGDPINRVMAWLGSKKGLLILDNCEHLIDASASFCYGALMRCPNLSLVTTSREALRVTGEACWPVTPLDESDAIALFEHRARLVIPDFRVSTSNHREVGRICRSLDELPLAIELAASGVGVMSVRAIASQLATRATIPTGESRTAPKRQQTMEATIDWSYRLLTNSEAALFRRLSVFRGGFALESAANICGDQQVPDVHAALGGLVRKSMVLVERLEDGETRYRLLESSAVYAQIKLTSSNESEATRRRHYDYFLAGIYSRTSSIGARADFAMGSDAEKWKQREASNLWAALQWARTEAPDKWMNLAADMAFAFETEPTRAVLVEALEQSTTHNADWMRASIVAAYTSYKRSRSVDMLRFSSDLEDVARLTRDYEYLATALNAEGVALQDLHQYDAAMASFDEALALSRSTNQIGLIVELQNSLGILALVEGRFEAARTILAECVQTARDVVHPYQYANYLESFANSELFSGDHDRAKRTWSEALTLARDNYRTWTAVMCLGGLSRVATAQGDHPRAVRLAAAYGRHAAGFSYSDSDIEWLGLSEEISTEQLGPVRSEAAHREGVAMTLERAIEYALEESVEISHPTLPLSRREHEVAGLVAAGMKNREIAERLFVSERTVEGHVERIRNKLDLRSRAELATWATKHGLAKPGSGSLSELSNTTSRP